MVSARIAPPRAKQNPLIRAGQTELPQDFAMRNHLTGTNLGARLQNGASIPFGNRLIVDRRA
jgi:hypothetical protein